MVDTHGNTTKYTIHSTYPLNNGQHIPRFGLGTWRALPGVVEHVVKHAILHGGYIHIDTATDYGNHNEVGQGIKDAIKESNGQIKRSDIWITSKLWNTHHVPLRARQQIDNILNELQLDYIDCLLIHWPSSWQWKEGQKMALDVEDRKIDTSHSRIDTWRVLEEAVRQGKVRTIGVSNFSTEQVDEILQSCSIRPAINQCESHPYFNNIPLQKDMEQRGICFEGYSPLGNTDGNVSESPMAEESIKSLAKKYNKTPAQVIIRWHLQSNRIVIPKSSKPERAIENSQIFDFSLSDSEIEQINKLDKGAAGRQNNPEFYGPGKKVFPTA